MNPAERNSDILNVETVTNIFQNINLNKKNFQPPDIDLAYVYDKLTTRCYCIECSLKHSRLYRHT